MFQGPNPHGFSFETWHLFFGTTVAATLAAIKLFLNRKEPSANVRRTTAEARKTETETVRDAGDIAMAFLGKIAEIQQRYDDQRDRHEKQVEFLRSQILHRQDQEEAARTRAHDAMDELNRAVSMIKQYEMILIEKKIEFIPFTVKTFKEITAHSEDK